MVNENKKHEVGKALVSHLLASQNQRNKERKQNGIKIPQRPEAFKYLIYVNYTNLNVFLFLCQIIIVMVIKTSFSECSMGC